MNHAAESRESIVSRALWRVYERLPAAVDEAMLNAHHGLRERTRHRVRIERFWGEHPATGDATNVILADPTPASEYFLRYVVGTEPRRETLRDAHRRDVADTLERLADGATILIARIGRRRANGAFGAPWLRMPESVNTVMSIPEDGVLHPRARKSQLANLKILEQSELNWEVSTDLSDFDRFYHDMYVPFTLQRHGEMAYVRRYARLRRDMRRGGIFWMLRDGRRILGELFLIEGDTIHWVCTGAVTDTDEAMQCGATIGLYVFGAEYARRRGIREFDLGECRPALADGVLWHKLRWGARVRPSRRARFDLMIRWPRLDEAVVRFIADTMPIVREGETLTALTARVGDDPPRVIEAPGVARHRVINPRPGTPPP